MYDARAIANLILDEGRSTGRPVTNLALQKLLYFAHALYLVERREPLVSGYFEAWQFGPVHPTVYQAFKTAGERPIDFRAEAINIMSGARVPIAAPADPGVLHHIRHVMVAYGRMTPGRLVDVSHAKGAPWHFVVENSKNAVAIGLRIPDTVILERFKYHKVSVSEVPTVGEPGDDSPLLARD